MVFVDEVEDLASIRNDERRVSPSVTNEFLKQIPRMREAPHHLLACATNWVSRLDSAFLRPGRFDYVLPGRAARRRRARELIWRRYIGEITDEPVDVGELVLGEQPLHPGGRRVVAARNAAQMAFEREHFDGVGQRATTDDFLAAIRSAKPTLTQEMIDEFRVETERFKRA